MNKTQGSRWSWLRAVVGGLKRPAQAGRAAAEKVILPKEAWRVAFPRWAGRHYVLSVQHHHGRNRKERRAFEKLTATWKRRSLTAWEAAQYTMLHKYGA